MQATCVRCEQTFEAEPFRGYCDECLSAYQANREGVHARQRPAPGVIADGKFSDEKLCPVSLTHPVLGEQVCGICGSSDIEQGYGLGSGYGMGSYTFCQDCYAFLDFSEDNS